MPIITIVILVNSRQDKTRQEEIYIDSLHIMTITMTATMIITIIIQ